MEAVRGPPVVVYNFEVENTHTYFVGKQGVWVHNACFHNHHDAPLFRGNDDVADLYDAHGIDPNDFGTTRVDADVHIGAHTPYPDDVVGGGQYNNDVYGWLTDPDPCKAPFPEFIDTLKQKYGMVE